MTVQPKRHISEQTQEVYMLLLHLMVEMGYLDAKGNITPLGEMYLDALKQAGELKLIDSPLPPPPINPNRLDPSGGRSWSDLPDF